MHHILLSVGTEASLNELHNYWQGRIAKMYRRLFAELSLANDESLVGHDSLMVGCVSHRAWPRRSVNGEDSVSNYPQVISLCCLLASR